MENNYSEWHCVITNVILRQTAANFKAGLAFTIHFNFQHSVFYWAHQAFEVDRVYHWSLQSETYIF